MKPTLHPRASVTPIIFIRDTPLLAQPDTLESITRPSARSYSPPIAMVRSGPAGSGTTPSVPSESPECLNEDPIVSKWQELASINQRSPDFLPLLSSLVTGTGYLSTTKLRDESAKITLDALDKVCFPLVVPKKRLDNDVHYVIH